MALLLALLGGAGSDRDLTSAGVSTVNFIDAAFNAQSLSSAGASTVTFQGVKVVDEALSSAGVSTVTFNAAAVQARNLSSPGVSTVTFNSARVLDEALSSAGISTVTFQGEDGSAPTVTEERDFASAGVSIVVFQAENIGVGTGIPPITGWAGDPWGYRDSRGRWHSWGRKRKKPIDEVLADIMAEPPGMPTPAERAALKHAQRKLRQQSEDDDEMILLLMSLH